MVFEKMYKAEDGTFILLTAESEEELARWDLEALTMAEDPAFKSKVEDDCRSLQKAVSDVGKSTRDWMVVEDFVRFSNAYENLRPHFLKDNFYDLRYQYSPSFMRALKEELSWRLNLLRLWYRHLEVAYKPEPKKQLPEYKSKKQKKRELTLTHEINRIESLRPDRRSEYLADKGEDITLAWLAHRIEQQRLREARLKEEEKERNIRRYKQTARLEAEKLSEAKEAEEDLRETLKKWVQEKQTR